MQYFFGVSLSSQNLDTSDYTSCTQSMGIHFLYKGWNRPVCEGATLGHASEEWALNVGGGAGGAGRMLSGK